MPAFFCERYRYWHFTGQAGAESCWNLLVRIEQEAKENKLQEIKALFGQFEQELEKVEKLLS